MVRPLWHRLTAGLGLGLGLGFGLVLGLGFRLGLRSSVAQVEESVSPPAQVGFRAWSQVLTWVPRAQAALAQPACALAGTSGQDGGDSGRGVGL